MTFGAKTIMKDELDLKSMGHLSFFLNSVMHEAVHDIIVTEVENDDELLNVARKCFNELVQFAKVDAQSPGMMMNVNILSHLLEGRMNLQSIKTEVHRIQDLYDAEKSRRAAECEADEE
jgi:hypothetical protein